MLLGDIYKKREMLFCDLIDNPIFAKTEYLVVMNLHHQKHKKNGYKTSKTKSKGNEKVDVSLTIIFLF